MLLILFLIGALQPVSKEKYEHAVDYVGWQVIEAYMQDYTNIRPDRVPEQKGYELFQQQFPTEAYSITSPPPSDEVEQVLVNHDWRNAYKNLYSRVINWKSMYNENWNEQEAANYLEKQVDNISLRSLGVEDSAYVRLQLTQARLKDEIAQFFAGPLAEAQAEETTEEAPVVAQEKSPAVSGNNQFSFLSAISAQDWLDYQINLISIVLILVLLGLLLYLFNMYKKMDERLDRHRKEINEINSELFVLKKKVANVEKETKLSGRLEALENKVERINDEYDQPEVAKAVHTSTERAPSIIATKLKTEEFYLSTPNSDGTFNVSSMSSSYKPTASIYRFLVTEEDGKSVAAFTVADQYETIKDALSSPGSYLDPVCESVNAFSPAAKKIINLRPGRAYKSGDKWIVKPEDKAIIRYE